MSKITDRNKRGSNRTKNILLKGYPSVIFCTAKLKIDEQEATRFLLLSPETDQEKIREAVNLAIFKECNVKAYNEWLNSDPDRQSLKMRIQAIKDEGIDHIDIPNMARVEELFYTKRINLKSRHARDIKRVLAIIKALALLNVWFRDKEGSNLMANEQDITEAFRIWDIISEPQELNIPPYVHEVYVKVLQPLWQEKEQSGITRKELMKRYFLTFHKHLPYTEMKYQVIPMLESAGLISQEPNPDNKREELLLPV